jgi:predicted SAM-dependent methyltransferase
LGLSKKINLRTSNLGCKIGVSSAIDWFFEKNEFGIVVEDDVVVSSDFLKFCDEMLTVYKDNEKIQLISGSNFQAGGTCCEGYYYFSKFAHIWGWATWKRVWNNYDVKMNDFPSQMQRRFLDRCALTLEEKKYWTGKFISTHKGEIDSWDYQLVYSIMKNQGLCINPNVNLTRNIGFDSRATHTVNENSPFAKMQLGEIDWSKPHPEKIEINHQADLFTSKNVFNINIHDSCASQLNVNRDMNSIVIFERSLLMIDRQMPEDALKLLSSLKGVCDSELMIDLARSRAFLKLGKMADAFEAVKESLRFHPDDIDSKVLSEIILQKIPQVNLPENPEFREVYSRIRNYTMVGVDRLYSLYLNAKRVCWEDLPGNFVECGVAAGGSSAMLAYVIKKYSKRQRKIFSFDTFEGMPEAGEKDSAFGVKAEDTGWGKGTCAAPLESLQEAAKGFEAWDRIVAVKGLFADTLPKHKQAIGSIAFLHADGDWYESTMDIFNNLYESVVDHGFIQIDDYGYWQGCKQAIHEFEARCGVKFPLKAIDATGVSFTKSLPRDHFAAKLLPAAWNFPQKGSSAHQLKPRLNLGCGSQVHPEWTNVDIMPRHPGVINHDLNKRLPFANASFEVVYHSHVLEHLTKEQGKAFVEECYRVLKPGGILRVVVPDLETIAKLYLENLDKAESGDGTASNRHEWMLLELLDQMVRETSGGEMGRYFHLNPMPAEDFVTTRLGHQVLEVIRPLRANPALRNRPVPPSPRPIDAMEAARFRQSGEIHKWMYDRRSLGKLLAESGLKRVEVKTAWESSIPEFGTYFLDRMPDGSTRKPDSLFMEAFKP